MVNIKCARVFISPRIVRKSKASCVLSMSIELDQILPNMVDDVRGSQAAQARKEKSPNPRVLLLNSCYRAFPLFDGRGGRGARTH